MLKQLTIKNFTLIDTLDMRFYPGFSVITGETGAGKSIILGAINLLLGQRADVKSIKSGCAKCTIEAHFDISRYQLEGFFTDNDIDYDAEDCILRRELSASGKSRAFINDTPVALSAIRNLGQQLVDIHSQHQNLLLGEEDFQLNVIDIIATDKALIGQYREAFNAYNTARKAVLKLKVEIDESKRNEDFLRFQLNELVEAQLHEGLQDELEQESEKLSHVEDIKTALYEVDNALNDSSADSGALDKLKTAARALEGITGIFSDVKPLSERLESCYIELKDIAQEVSSEAESVEFDPQRIEKVNSLLDKIYSLEQKHHVSSVEELLALQADIQKQISHIDNSDDELAALQEKEQACLAKCQRLAKELTSARMKAAMTVEKEMQSRLVPLGMPNVRFKVEISDKELSLDGGDKVAFLFSANTNTPMQPVSQVASGGEIARVMLSLKAMISGAVKLPTIIFDEIDTGVSGKIAEKMAVIMQEMGRAERQVISITHLPQIAARGANHYKVFKEETPNGTTSRMARLSDDERVIEIAQMLSGSSVTDAAINNARELLKSTE